MAGTETFNFSSGYVPIYSPQGLLSGVSKHTRLQYVISDPGLLELVAYRKPVVTFRRAGGLALTGWSARMTSSIKKSLTERYGARLVGTPQSMALGCWLMGASPLHPGMGVSRRATCFCPNSWE